MPQTMHEKFLHMTETPIRRLIPELAAPTILSMLVTSFYNMADTFFVGRINTQATAAVGVAFSFMAVLQACGFFFGHGSGNYISRRLGAEDIGNASRMAANGFFLSLITGTAILAAGLFFLEPLSLALGSTPTILPYTCDYLRIILLGSPFIMSSFVMNNQLRYQGSASYAMVGIVTGAVLNIALDPLLIFTFQMGIAGAAAATVISQQPAAERAQFPAAAVRLPGNPARRLPVAVPPGARVRGDGCAEPVGGRVRRRGNRGHVGGCAGNDVCKFGADRLGAGLPACVRVQLRRKKI